MNNLEDAAENFRLVYNKAWALFSGVRPMTQEEAMQMMKAMKPIIDPDIIFFAYFNDEPIGFFITVPDLNRIIGKFNGKFGLIQKLRLMWELKKSVNPATASSASSSASPPSSTARAWSRPSWHVTGIS